VHVIRHQEKKPAGSDVLQHFAHFRPSEMVMVGDRVRCCHDHYLHDVSRVFILKQILTDIVYGNRLGMLTVLVEPFTAKGDNPAAAAVLRLQFSSSIHTIQQHSTSQIRQIERALLPHIAVRTSPPPHVLTSCLNHCE
jgi:predicted HAD superfamily phosphohydrolase YqeG